jgi:hypothetical protein
VNLFVGTFNAPEATAAKNHPFHVVLQVQPLFQP